MAKASDVAVVALVLAILGVLGYFGYKLWQTFAQPLQSASSYLSSNLGGVPMAAFDITGLGGIAGLLQYLEKAFGGSSQRPTYAPNAQSMYKALAPSQAWYTYLAQNYGQSTGLTYALPNYPGVNFYMSPAQEFMA